MGEPKFIIYNRLMASLYFHLLMLEKITSLFSILINSRLYFILIVQNELQIARYKRCPSLIAATYKLDILNPFPPRNIFPEI